MTTNREDTVNAAVPAIPDAGIIDAVRAMGDDRVIASVRAAREAYAALHDHDIAAIFKDIRAAQKAAGRAYFRHVEPLAKAMTPITIQLSEVFQQLAVSLGPVNEGLKKLAEASAPYLAKWSELAPRLAEWSRTVDALNDVGWLPCHTAPFHHVAECGDDLDLLDRRFSEYYCTQWSEIRDDMESRLEDYHIDDEARETFREALSAHEAGLYRCVCRVLFPEIERTIGAGLGPKRLLEKLTGTGDLADYAFRELCGYVLFGRLVKHVYESGTRGDLRAGSGPESSRCHARAGVVFNPQTQHEHADPDGLHLPDPSSDRGFQHVAGDSAAAVLPGGRNSSPFSPLQLPDSDPQRRPHLLVKHEEVLGAFALGGEAPAAVEPVHGAVESPMGASQPGRHQVGVVEVRQGRVGIGCAGVEDGLRQSLEPVAVAPALGHRKGVVDDPHRVHVVALQSPRHRSHPRHVHGRGQEGEFGERRVGQNAQFLAGDDRWLEPADGHILPPL